MYMYLCTDIWCPAPQPLDSIPDQVLKLLKVAQNEFLGFGIAGTHTTHSIDHKLVDLELEYRPVY